MGLEVKIYDTPAGGISASQGTFSSLCQTRSETRMLVFFRRGSFVGSSINLQQFVKVLNENVRDYSKVSCFLILAIAWFGLMSTCSLLN